MQYFANFRASWQGTTTPKVLIDDIELMHALYEESITKSLVVPNMMAILGVQKFRSTIRNPATEIPTIAINDDDRNDIPIESLEIDENVSTDADSNLYESIGEISKISELETQNEDINRRLKSLEIILHQTNEELQKQKEGKGNLEKQIAEISFVQNAGGNNNVEEDIGNMTQMIKNCEDRICELNQKKIGYLNQEYELDKSKVNIDEKQE